MFVAYPLIWSVPFRDRIRGLLSRPVSVWLMATAICLLLWFEETWVIVDYGSSPWRHYVHYFGFYFGMTATIIWLYCRYRYTVLQTFVVGGLWACSSNNNSQDQRCLSPGRWSRRLASGCTSSPSMACTLRTTAVVFRGVQPVESDEPLARHSG